jgi:putative transposase
MIFSPLSTSSPVEQSEKDVTRIRKLRIYPTKQQKQTLKKWMGTCRFIYNRALDSINKKQEKSCSFYSLRDKYVTSKSNDLINKWELETPKDVRAGAIKDLSDRYLTLIKMVQEKKITHFKMNFRSKRKDTSIVIPKKTINFQDGNLYIYTTKYKFGIVKITKRQRLFLKKNPIEKDSRLQIKRGKYFLCIPIKIKTRKTQENKGVCSLDPGVRKFQTVYSNNEVVHIGVKRELMKKYFNKLDKLQSLRMKGQINKKKRYENRVRDKLENLIDDLHYKTINYLTKTYSTIILPTFESQKLLKKMEGRITKRMLLAYYQFKVRLQEKCVQDGNRLEICTEEYTSKTCGQCGNIKNDLKKQEVYKCIKCGLEVDRDTNGARNIMIKVMNEQHQDQRGRATYVENKRRTIKDKKLDSQEKEKKDKPLRVHSRSPKQTLSSPIS